MRCTSDGENENIVDASVPNARKTKHEFHFNINDEPTTYSPDILNVMRASPRDGLHIAQEGGSVITSHDLSELA